MCVYCIAILKHYIYIYIWFIINAQKRLPSRPIHNSSPPQRLQAQAEEYSPQAAQVGSLGKEASTFQILSHQNHQRQNWSLCKKTEVGGEAILQVLCTDGMCSPDQFSIGWSKTSLEKKELNHVKPDFGGIPGVPRNFQQTQMMGNMCTSTSRSISASSYP